MDVRIPDISKSWPAEAGLERRGIGNFAADADRSAPNKPVGAVEVCAKCMLVRPIDCVGLACTAAGHKLDNRLLLRLTHKRSRMTCFGLTHRRTPALSNPSANAVEKRCTIRAEGRAAKRRNWNEQRKYYHRVHSL